MEPPDDDDHLMSVVFKRAPEGEKFAAVAMNWGSENIDSVVFQEWNCTLSPRFPDKRIPTEITSGTSIEFYVQAEDIEKAWILAVWSSRKVGASRAAWYPVAYSGVLAETRRRQLKRWWFRNWLTTKAFAAVPSPTTVAELPMKLDRRPDVFRSPALEKPPAQSHWYWRLVATVFRLHPSAEVLELEVDAASMLSA